MSVAKLVHGWIDPTRIDEAAEAVGRELVPAFVAQPGAEGGYWMANRANGHVLVMMTWVDASAVRASRTADGAARVVAAERVGLRLTAVQTMEVIGAYESAPAPDAVWRWARATWVHGATDEAGVDLTDLHRRTVPEQQQSQGFCGSYWLADRETGNGMALSFWEGPAARDESRRASRRRRRRFEASIGCRIGLIAEYEAIGSSVATPAAEEIPILVS